MSFSDRDFRNWITSSESAYNKVRADDDKAIEYIENAQEPTSVPAGKQYVKYNVMTYRIRRRIGEILNSRMKPTLLGAGKLVKPLVELFQDILDENRFQDRVLASAMHYFFPTGRSGFKFVDNPRKESKYGIGFPGIVFLRPDEIRTDPNARDPFHYDDIFRAHAKRIELDYAKRLFKDHADDINEHGDSKTGESETTKYALLHEIEYRENEFELVETDIEERNPKTGTPFLDKFNRPIFKKQEVEREVYYITKYINNTKHVMTPERTGYPTFRIIPLIHTPRVSDEKGRNGFGLWELLNQSQDLLNVGYTVLLECVKASIKQMVISTGANEDEQAEHQRQMSKTNAYYGSRNPSAKLNVIQGPPLPPSVVQFVDRARFMVDEIEASYAPDRGQVSGAMSGKAISNLQVAGSVPEITSKNNIKTAMTDLAICIFHYIRKMKGEFSLNRNIDGQEQEIAFNRAADEGDDIIGDFNVFHGGFVNKIEDIPKSARIRIEIEMNHHAKRQDEINTALLLDERGKIALRDLLEILYPNAWEERLENIKAENQAQALIQDMLEVDPGAVEHLAQFWNQNLKPQLEAVQKRQKKVS